MCSPRSACLALSLLLSTSVLVSAQTVRGKVTDATDGAPMVGAVVTLLDAEGTRQRAVLSNPDGLFGFTDVVRGRYRLLAEMIGRKGVQSEAFTVADDAPFLTLSLPFEPIRLDALDINSAKRCSVRDDAARATHVVWEEAQKALNAESITRAQAVFRFDVRKVHRLLGDHGKRVLDEQTRLAAQVDNAPFSTLPPEDLAREGYVRRENGDFWVYGPSTNVLLSSGFQATHCFALTRETQHPGLIGLSFRPIPGRRLTDIEGVLWLDERTAELQTLEFSYRNIPRNMLAGDYTGHADFQRLDTGAWIIRKWWLRSPSEAYRGHTSVLLEESGEVLNIHPVH